MKKPNFANGHDYFCMDCNLFFSVRLHKDHIGQAAFCPWCGEDTLIVTTDDLLNHCEDNDTDPVNFYHAFPQDEPIPQSCTGATPLQVEIIIGLVAMRKQEKLPVAIDGIAGESESDRDIVRKVFEKLHITETGGTE